MAHSLRFTCYALFFLMYQEQAVDVALFLLSWLSLLRILWILICKCSVFGMFDQCFVQKSKLLLLILKTNRYSRDGSDLPTLFSPLTSQQRGNSCHCTHSCGIHHPGFPVTRITGFCTVLWDSEKYYSILYSITVGKLS